VRSRLAGFLDENGITKAEVAQALSLDPSAVSRKVTGSRHWKLVEVQALLAFLTERLARPVTYELLFAPEPEAAETVVAPDPSAGAR
jgi:predicted transcriptional regulator